MAIFENAKWIWHRDVAEADEYCEFFAEFDLANTEDAICRISCDSDYTLFINGNFAACNQFADFEHYKIYDEIDITPFVKKGKNTLSAVVWHFGIETSRYKKYAAGLIFEIISGGKVISESSEKTGARLSPTYESGRCGIITRQLGFGFHYDASKDDGRLFTGEGFGNAVSVEKNCTFFKRIGEKLRLAPSEKAAKITSGNDGKYYLVDLGEETVGLLKLSFDSENAQKIRIDWGEDLIDGHVRRIIGERLFSVDYTAKAGRNEYVNYMLRFGGRYLEIYSEEPIKLEYAGLIPQFYPTKRNCAILKSELDRRIYDLCARTLELSMMEHYVDCPWREQALYAFDSRNQMLSGYYVFENGNTEYVYSNLRLISNDKRENDLLSICYPTGKLLAIPSFSLHYFKAVLEYYEHTKDTKLLSEVYGKLLAIAKTFYGNIKESLVYTFGGKTHWNFYDWSEHLDGEFNRGGEGEADSIINFLFIIALDSLEKISAAIGKDFPYPGVADKLRKATMAFFDTDEGLFALRRGGKEFTSLANALAIISGTVAGEQAKKICEALICDRVTESSLSLKCFIYDALLMTDEKYRDFVLSDIRKNYGFMLDAGATSAWETIKGSADFGGAGSLCHGWSAIPVYYYHKFGMVKNQ